MKFMNKKDDICKVIIILLCVLSPTLVSARSFAGVCNTLLKPDYVVVYGGIETSGSELVKAVKDGDKLVEKVKKIATENKGELVLLDKLRYIGGRVRNRSRARRMYRSYLKSNGSPNKINTAQFTVVQRLEIHLPMNSNYDRVITDLMSTRLIRIGKNFSQSRGRVREPVMYYRFKNIEGQLEKLKESCVVSALTKWCKRISGAASHKPCLTLKVKNRKNIEVVQFRVSYVASRTIYGRMKQAYLTYPWLQNAGKKIELISNTPTYFQGRIQIKHIVE